MVSGTLLAAAPRITAVKYGATSNASAAGQQHRKLSVPALLDCNKHQAHLK
jgi:hypothetical protein